MSRESGKMNRMKIFNKFNIIAGLICLSSFSLTALELTEYTSEELGIVIEYPSDWIVEETFNMFSFSTRENFGYGEDPCIGVSIGIEIVEEMDISSEEESIEVMGLDNYLTSEPERVELAGKNWLHVYMDNPDYDLKAEIYLLIKDDFLYIIMTVVIPKEEYELNTDIFEVILNSIRFTNNS
jgi:hypothetical protein